jgi:hypothetical protein
MLKPAMRKMASSSSANMEEYSDEEVSYLSPSSITSRYLSSEKENIAPSSSSEILPLTAKRSASPGLPPPKRSKPAPSPELEKRAIEQTLFAGMGLNVTPVDTFISEEDRLADELSAKEDVKLSADELQKLIESIPLEKEEESQELQDMLLVFHERPEVILGVVVLEV